MDKQGKTAILAVLIVAIAIFALAVYAAHKQCNNGADDDGDGLTDFPNDPGCSSNNDNSETSSSLVCDNGQDEANDADTLADFRLVNGDPGCTSAGDTNEQDGACDNTFDDDLDGVTDFPNDPECASFADFEYECADTDGGINIVVQGSAFGSNAGVFFNETDFCVDATLLTEYFCASSSNPRALNRTCANETPQCSNGACV